MRSATRCTTSPSARDVASVGGLALVTFLVVAGNALLADLSSTSAVAGTRPAFAARRRGHRRDRCVATGGDRRRPSATDARPDRCASRCSRATTRTATSPTPRRGRRYLPRSHFELAEGITDPVDLIVFPESSMDEDPRVDRVPRRVSSRELATRHDAWVLANAVADAPDGRAVNLNLLYGPDGDLQGTYAKRHLVPYGERVPFRSLLEDRISALDRIPRDFAPGDDAGLFDDRRVRGRDGDLLRIGVRLPDPAARARRRRGDRRVDEQPLVPPLGELRAARRDRTDARGRDRPAGRAGRDLRHLGAHRRERSRCTAETELFERTRAAKAP